MGTENKDMPKTEFWERRKYNLIEFIAATESEDFDDIHSPELDWAAGVIASFGDIQTISVHAGDCTRENYSCSLCAYERILEEFREYTFDEEGYRRKRGLRIKK